MPRVTKAGGGELVVQSVGTAHLQRDGEARGRDAQHLLFKSPTLIAAATSPAASRRNRSALRSASATSAATLAASAASSSGAEAANVLHARSQAQLHG